MAILVSLQVARVRQFVTVSPTDDRAVEWHSAIDKRPVARSLRLGVTQLEGDEQADLKHHGGPDKALLAYSADHYDAWRAEFPDRDWAYGGFGENLTIRGLDEPNVCLGDRFQIGECLVEVSQPRQPCWKLSRRWQLPELAATVIRNGRTGWYLRVIATGMLSVGLPVELVARPYPHMTVAWAHRIMHSPERNFASDRELADCPALAQSWRETLLQRLAKNSN